jgi:hypothetical protein
MASSCEHGNEPTGPTKGGEFRDQLSDYRLWMTEVVSCSETSVSIFQTTRHYIPENTRRHNLRRENLKSHVVL